MPTNETDVPDVVTTVESRLAVLESLIEDSRSMRDLQDHVNQSRSTLNRAVRALEDAGLVTHTDGGYRATLTGRLAAEQCRDHFNAMTDITEMNAALAPLTPDTAVSSAMLVGAEAHVATEPAPYRAEASLKRALSEASCCRFFAASLPDPDYHHMIYERTLSDELRGESIITPQIHEVMQSDFETQMAELVATGNQRVFVWDGIDYGLFLFEGLDQGPSAFLIVGDERMGVHAVVSNDTPAAVRWAEERYRTVRERATDVTDEYRTNGATNAG